MARPFRDNTRLIVAGIVALLALLAALLTLASRSARLAPDVLAELVLYALSATNVTFLVALGFVLARNIIKLVVERRRALPFSRFRAKLVGMLLGMTIVPAVLVLLVGSELIRNSVDRWFNAPMEDILGSANQIASDYYEQRQAVLADHAARIARTLGDTDLTADDVRPIRDLLALDIDVSGFVPADDGAFGFDNIGGVAKLSPLLMESYLTAAKRISQMAMGTPPSVVENRRPSTAVTVAYIESVAVTRTRSASRARSAW